MSTNVGEGEQNVLLVVSDEIKMGGGGGGGGGGTIIHWSLPIISHPWIWLKTCHMDFTILKIPTCWWYCIITWGNDETPEFLMIYNGYMISHTSKSYCKRLESHI